VLVLGAGLAAVCLLAVAVVIDASALFLQRQHLVSLADAAALAGAQALDSQAYYAEGASAATALDPSAVSAAALRHLRLSTGGGSVEVTRIWSDGRQVVVGLSGALSLPFLPALFPDRLAVESWAQLAYRPVPSTG
jgi:Flp pilus assembly protein TadG